MQIKITVKDFEITAKLNETRTASALFSALPITSVAHRWGEEVYFEVPLDLRLENGREVLEVGDVVYWPPRSMCIFFGPTPSSTGSEVRAYSAVNVFGKIIGDVKVFEVVEEGDEIRVEPE